MVSDPDSLLSDAARPALQALVCVLTELEAEIRRLEAEIVRRAKDDEVARRLMTIPGVGPLIATALVALAPPPETFRRGRDFAAWLGLVPDGEERQSARFDRYEAALTRLVEAGRAYPAYETAQELDLRRKVALGRGLPPIYDRTALALG